MHLAGIPLRKYHSQRSIPGQLCLSHVQYLIIHTNKCYSLGEQTSQPAPTIKKQYPLLQLSFSSLPYSYSTIYNQPPHRTTSIIPHQSHHINHTTSITPQSIHVQPLYMTVHFLLSWRLACEFFLLFTARAAAANTAAASSRQCEPTRDTSTNSYAPLCFASDLPALC